MQTITGNSQESSTEQQKEQGDQPWVDVNGQPNRTGNSKPKKPKHHFELGSETEIAQHIIDSFGTNVVESNGTFYLYKDGYFTSIDQKTVIERRIVALDGSTYGDSEKPKTLRTSANFKRGVIDNMRSLCGDDSFFSSKNVVHGVVCDNGFLTVDYDQLKVVLWPNSPDFRARHKVEGSYFEGMTCPEYDKFLYDRWDCYSNEEIQSRIRFTKEWFGICRIGLATKFATAVFCTGNTENMSEDGFNGKSTYIDIGLQAFDPCLKANCGPHKWARPSDLAELQDKLINTDNDVDADALTANGYFKKGISGEKMQVDRKFERPFVLEPVAGHMLAGNGVPSITDFSKGFERRLAVLDFPKVIKGKDDKFFAQRLFEKEGVAIVAAFLQGACDALKRGCFLIPELAKEITQQHIKNSDSVYRWMCDRFDELEVQSPRGVTLEQMWNSYTQWGQVEGLGKFTLLKRTFERRLTKYFNQRKIDSGRIRIYEKKVTIEPEVSPEVSPTLSGNLATSDSSDSSDSSFLVFGEMERESSGSSKISLGGFQETVTTVTRSPIQENKRDSQLHSSDSSIDRTQTEVMDRGGSAGATIKAPLPPPTRILDSDDFFAETGMNVPSEKGMSFNQVSASFLEQSKFLECDFFIDNKKIYWVGKEHCFDVAHQSFIINHAQELTACVIEYNCDDWKAYKQVRAQPWVSKRYRYIIESKLPHGLKAYLVAGLERHRQKEQEQPAA